MDHLDQAILTIVQRNNQLTHSEIGRAVSLSPSSVRRRLAKLRADKVIEADVSIVNAKTNQITVIVAVSFQQESLESVNDFKRRMVDAPEVSQCYSVAGQIDYVLVVHATDLHAYEHWGERVLMNDPAIRRYDTYIVWSRVKFSTAVPMLSAAS